jgi:hypothetical protein
MMGSMRTSGRVVLPVVLRLGMHHSWHQPKWLGRILPKVRFSH